MLMVLSLKEGNELHSVNVSLYTLLDGNKGTILFFDDVVMQTEVIKLVVV